MKKIILSTFVASTILFGSDSILGEFGSSNKKVSNSINLDIGVWNIDWEQTSSSSEMLKDQKDALDVDYSIESSLAFVASLKLNYHSLSGTIEYKDNSFNAGDGGEINSLNVGLALLDLIPYFTVEARYIKSNFNGAMSAMTQSGTDVSSGTFSTKLQISDIIIYPFNDYLGFGYRNYNYEFPQDMYIINNLDSEVYKSSLAYFAYEGYFYTLAFDNKKLVNPRNNYNGLVYSFTLGVGELSPKILPSEVIDSESASTLNSSYLGDSDTLFYDIQVGYSYKSKKRKDIGYGITAGYRYNKIEVDESSTLNENGYNIKTKFNTEFYGPFLDLNIRY